jgi:NAD-dependent SIR2 family protein deacetylase
LSQLTIEQAARAVQRADAIFVGAGAGMGVDSGLPDFRGDGGFWRAYPPFEKRGLNFMDLANPSWFERDPRLAWGFYGHRLHLYRDTEPHRGFELLRQWGDRSASGYFVFTSNVDGQFQAAGFDPQRIVECHGSIHHMQCTAGCHRGIWPADDVDVDVDSQTFRASPPLPRCTKCNTLARPNILMFGDSQWLAGRSEAQQARMTGWLQRTRAQNVVIIEAGAGTAVPTVRWQCERLADLVDATLIRINPREAQGPPGTLSLATGALEALEAIEALLGGA